MSDTSNPNPTVQVITAMEAVAGTSDVYHLVNDGATGSRCGSIKVQTQFGRHAHELLSREEAEQQGLEPCSRCLEYTSDH